MFKGMQLKMNKKGVMTKFLVGILLAIILFGGSAYMMSKFFRVSDQARNNFYDFNKEIKEFAKKSANGDKSSFLSIMDEKTFLTLYTKESADQKKSLDVRSPREFRSSIKMFKYPQAECQGKACFCLCQKIGEKNPINCEKIFCETYDNVGFWQDFSIGREKGDVRRRVVILEKVNGKVKVSIPDLKYLETLNVDTSKYKTPLGSVLK